MVSLNLNMAALVTFLDIAQFLLGLVDLRLLANDGRFEAAATLLGTESSSDSTLQGSYSPIVGPYAGTLGPPTALIEIPSAMAFTI
jgi:hypothetical protein